MKLTIFQSDKGACLLLEAASGELVLCDGGTAPSMKQYVLAKLSALRDAGRELELVYVSHINDDHIGGALQLLEDEATWCVFDYREKIGDPIQNPDGPRPPVIKGILHNGFYDLMTAKDDSTESPKAIKNLLCDIAPSLFATAVPELVSEAEEILEVVNGGDEGIRLSKLIASDAFKIPLNNPPGVREPSRLLYAGQPGDEFEVGSMRFTLICPTEDEIKDLRAGWKNWLRISKERLKKIRAELGRRVNEFSAGTLTDLPFDLREWEGIQVYRGVSVPKVVSLMFMVEEDGKRLLLTGDGKQDFILSGLKRTGFLKNGYLHLDALKVQRHGSKNNVYIDFARKVSADHYVFCGNGEHGNPDLGVIDIIFNSRLGNSSVRALAPQAENRPFHFWFSTASAELGEKRKKQGPFREVEKKVEMLAAQSNGLLHLHFNETASIVLEI